MLHSNTPFILSVVKHYYLFIFSEKMLCLCRRNVSSRSCWSLISTTVVIGRSPVLPPPPSHGPRVEPPCRVQSGWERNALGCGAAATVGNRRSNSHSMDTNDPYLHLSKYATVIYIEPILAVVFLPKLLHFVLT